MRVVAGERFGKYRVIADLGRGGMGAVLRAHDPTLDREIAIKILDTAGDSSEEARRRVMREARAAAAINHPSAVSVYEVGEVEGVPYIAMELIEGRTLRAYIGDPDVSLSQKMRWMLDVARALSAAHERAIVHRDVKPENVMVRADGGVKVLDFGIARRPQGSDSLGGVSAPGTLVGTPCYMAPEQVRGDELDGRVDQFAWGIATFELVSGKLPWGSHEQPLRAIAEMTMRPAPRLDGVPDDVAAIVGRALEVDRAKRFGSMETLVSDLGHALAALPVDARRPSAPVKSNREALATTEAASPSDPPRPHTPPAPAVRSPAAETIDGHAATAPADSVPKVIGGKYRFVRFVAKGGMGVIYEVEHVHTGERCALKVLEGVVASDPVSVERFKLEARVSSRVKSEHVVRVLDADVAPDWGGRFYLVMELLEGDALADVAGSTAQPPARVVSWLRDVVRGLEAAHREGIVHRDLKPSNLFLARRADGSGVVKLLDFGLAKIGGTDSSRTAEGAIVGTPQYMAPEQADGRARTLSHHADVWAIGVMAFRFLSGGDYFVGSSIPDVLAKVLYSEIEPPSSRGLDLGAAFDAWFLRSCRRDPLERHASVRAQLESLEDALGIPHEATPSSPQEAVVARTGDQDKGGSLRGSSADSPAPGPPPRRTWPAVAIAAFGAIAIASVAANGLRPQPTSERNEKAAGSEARSAATASAPTPISPVSSTSAADGGPDAR